MKHSLKTIVVDLTPVLPGGENGGAKIFVLELIRGLAKFAPLTQFILLTQVSSHDELAILDNKNVRRLLVIGKLPLGASKIRKFLHYIIRYLPSSLKRLIYLMHQQVKKNASTFLNELDIDLLFCPFTAPTYHKAGVPTVCTLYDLQYKTYPDFFSVEDNGHRDFVFKEVCRKATRIAAISEYSRQSAIVHGQLTPDRIKTIYLRMAGRILKNKNSAKLLSVLGLNKNNYLLYPANFWKHKNHEMLLTAFNIACHEGLGSSIKLVCTGAPGERCEWLRQAAASMGLMERVIFPGFLSNEDLGILIKNCVGVVYPSLYEGFGLPIIEAMAAGVPVACSNVTSLPEVGGNAALFFNPRIPTDIAKAMILLINYPHKEELINEGLRNVAIFSNKKQMIEEYWCLFQEALLEESNINELSGVYEDGWISANLAIHVIPSKSKRQLEMELFVPEWLPSADVTLSVFLKSNKQSRIINLRRGHQETIVLDIPNIGEKFDIKATPTFIPLHAGACKTDSRELSLTLNQCRIIDEQGFSETLFSKDKK